VVQQLPRAMRYHAGQPGQHTQPLSFERSWTAPCRDHDGIAFAGCLACGVTQQPSCLGWIGTSQHGELEGEIQGDQRSLPGFA
jgi:hypothetical protein